MALTTVTVTGTYIKTGTGLPHAGTVRFMLTAPMRDAETNFIVSPEEIRVTLNNQGSFSVNLYATNDLTVEPKGVTYEVTERLVGASLHKYFVSIDRNAIDGVVQLADIVPNINPVVQFNYATVEYVDQLIRAVPATSLTFAPTSEITATNVQAAIEQVRSLSKYVHVQSLPSTSWVITHNLKFFPNVSIVDSAETHVIGEVVYNSLNQLTVGFTSPFSGKAYLS